MRSKSTLVCALLLTLQAFGEAPATLFQSHREGILSGEVCVVEAYRFGVGRVTPRVDTPNARRIAKERSALFAQRDLLADIKLAGIVFPDKFTPQERMLLLASMRKNLSVSATVEGLQTVYQKWEGSQWITVVALPTASAAHIVPATFEDLRNHCHTIKHTLLPTLLEKLGILEPPAPSPDAPEKEPSEAQETVENAPTEPQAPADISGPRSNKARIRANQNPPRINHKPAGV